MTNRIQHALVEQTIAHPLGDDHVDFIDAVRQLHDVLKFAVHDCDHIFVAVVGNDTFRLFGNV